MTRISKRWMVIAIGAFAATAVMSSCAGDDLRSSGGPVVLDSAGVRIVEYLGPLSGALIRLNRIYDYGHSPGDYTFQDLFQGALQPDGSAVVSDAGSGELVRIEADGGNSIVLARKGQGPGEVLRVASIRVTGQDTLWVEDDGNSKVMLLEEGEVVRTIRTPGFDLGYGLRIEGIDESGDFLMRTAAFRPDFEEEWLLGSLVRLDPDSLVPDTVGHFPFVPHFPDTGANPFSYTGAIAGSGMGFIHGRSDTPQLVWRRPDGTVAQITRWVAQPRYPNPDDWDLFESAMRANLQRVSPGMGGDRLDEVLDAQIARFEVNPEQPLPFFGMIFGDNSGGVWVARYEPGAFPRASRYDVFSSAGEWIGEAVFETPVLILDVRDDRVLCVTFDSMDVQGIAEFHVEAGTL